MQFLAHPGGILLAALIILLAATSNGPSVRSVRLTLRGAVFAGVLLALFAAGAVRSLLYVAGVAR